MNLPLLSIPTATKVGLSQLIHDGGVLEFDFSEQRCVTLIDLHPDIWTMDASWNLSRRRFLASQLSLVTIATMAGCTDSGGEGEPTSDAQDTATTERMGESNSSDTPTSDGTGTEGTSDDRGDDSSGTDDLDLREANVVGVSFAGQNGTYTFDVTLHHDDEGEDGYANWWQVEGLDGTRFGRRELLHAHSQQPFTRSGTIEIPDDTNCVVVRGHDQTHEYGGLAILVDITSGETRLIDQGSDRQSFDPTDCP